MTGAGLKCSVMVNLKSPPPFDGHVIILTHFLDVEYTQRFSCSLPVNLQKICSPPLISPKYFAPYFNPPPPAIIIDNSLRYNYLSN